MSVKIHNAKGNTSVEFKDQVKQFSQWIGSEKFSTMKLIRFDSTPSGIEVANF